MVIKPDRKQSELLSVCGVDEMLIRNVPELCE